MNVKERTIIPVLAMAMLFHACSQPTDTVEEVVNDGKVSIENGKGERDSLTYKCLGCKEYIKKKKIFDKIATHASELTKEGLKFPLSYEPKSMELTIVKDGSFIDVDDNKKMKNITQVFSKIKYVAKNAYGNELEEESIQTFYLEGDKVVNIAGEIKLPKLQFDAGFINRSLNGEYGASEFIEFTPMKDKSIMIKSSLSCVEKGALIQINLENGVVVELNSWNDFNCDGNSYYHWFNDEQIAQLKSSKIKFLFFYSDSESVMVDVAKNQRDYFMQLFTLY